MIGGDYQKPGVLTFADEVYQEIQKKKFIIKFSDLKNKEPKYLLRMYGRINIHQISLSLNKKVVNYYKKISENFRASQVYFPSLVGKESLVDTRDTFLRDRSAYSVEAFFPTDVQIIRIYSRYLSYEPFPYQSAKCLKFYKIKKIKDNQAPYEFSKGLRKGYIERIQWIYNVFGTNPYYYIVGITIEEAIHGELEQIKCLPFPSQKASWKDTLIAWAKDPDWGGRIPQIGEAVSTFAECHYFSRFLEQREELITAKGCCIQIDKFSKNFEDSFSFKAYVIEKTVQEFFNYLFKDANPSDLEEIKEAFSKEMQNEKRRSTFVYYFADVVSLYEKIPRTNIDEFDYSSYQGPLKIQFKNLKHLIFKYNSECFEKGKKYSLSPKKEEFYDLLLSCLMAIHVFQACSMLSLKDRKEVFKGIYQMRSQEKLDFYQFLCSQALKTVPLVKTIQEQPPRPSDTLYDKIIRNPLSKLFFSSPRSLSSPSPVSDLKTYSEFLKGYSFSEAEKARIKIQLLFFHLGLGTKNVEAELKGFQPIDLVFSIKMIQDIQKISKLQLPGNVVSHILTWTYLDKYEKAGIEQIKFHLKLAKIRFRKLFAKEECFFFISSKDRQFIHEVVSKIIPKSSFVPQNNVTKAFYNCLQYAIFPHIAPSYFYPFIFLAFESGDSLNDSLFSKLQEWGLVHCGMFRKIGPYPSALRVETCWEEIASEEYFQLHLTYFPSSQEPRSFHMEETLRISRARLRQDPHLCQILRIFSIFLTDEFEPIKAYNLKFDEEKKYAEEGRRKAEAEPEYHEPFGELRLFENLLNFFDNPLFSSLWENYQAQDKDDLSKLIYEFFFQIKSNIREKMGKIFSKKISTGNMMEKVLEGITYHNEDAIALTPLHLLNNFPHYGVMKKNYFSPLSTLLEKMNKNLDWIQENFFSIDMGKEKLDVDVEYQFSVACHCDDQKLRATELECILEKKAFVEEDSLNTVLSKLKEAKFDENLIQTEKHEIIFICKEKGIDFSMAYQNVPSFEMLAWQIVMLKWKCFRAFEDQTNPII